MYIIPIFFISTTLFAQQTLFSPVTVPPLEDHSVGGALITRNAADTAAVNTLDQGGLTSVPLAGGGNQAACANNAGTLFVGGVCPGVAGYWSRTVGPPNLLFPTNAGDTIFPNGSNDVGSLGNTFNDGFFHTLHAQQFGLSVGGGGSDTFRFGAGTSTLAGFIVLADTFSHPVMAWGDTTAGSPTYGMENFEPFVNNTYDLGTPSLYWNNAYINNLNVNTCTGCPAGYWIRVGTDLKPANAGDTIFPNGTNDMGNAANTFNDGFFHSMHAQQFGLSVGAGGTDTFRFGAGSSTLSGFIVLSDQFSNSLMAWGPQAIGGPNYSMANFDPFVTSTYDLGTASLVWNNAYINTIHATSCTGCASTVAWSAYTASMTYTAGTVVINSQDCRTFASGKSSNVSCHVNFTLTGVGTASSYVTISLPVSAATNGQTFASIGWVVGYPLGTLGTSALVDSGLGSIDVALTSTGGVTYSNGTYDIVLTGVYDTV